MSETEQDESAKEGEICEINITEVERRCTGTVMPLQDVYVAYQVESIIQEPRKTPYIVWRRYRDFEYLHSHLQDVYRYVIIPPLPEKKVQFRWQKLPTDTLDPEFVERRRASLETFLRRLAAHQELSADTLLGHFLRHEASWRDDHSPGGGLLHRADSLLRSLSASLRLRSPDGEFEEVKRYSTELKANLTSFLRSRARLVDATLDFHAVHQQYGQVLSELSHREGPGGRGDHLQAAGQFMDRLAQAPLPFLEEQEEGADRLKEYLGYADALLAVCRHQELLQYELERKKSLYAARESQRLEMSQAAGQQGLVSRLLHPSTTPEQKAQALEQQLVSLDIEIRAATQSKQEFSEKALAEIAKFREQKEQDLNQALTILVSTNIRLCRESIAIWERVCQCFEEMCRLEDGAAPTKEQSASTDKASPAGASGEYVPAVDTTDSAVH